MPIKKSLEDSGRRAVIAVTGRFDFALHAAFREAYRDLATGCEVIVDLGEATYMDSSALGMLLLLRDHVGRDTAKVTIRRARDDVRRVLEIANFQMLFKLA